MPRVVLLTESEEIRIKAIVLDGDGEGALKFLKEKILKPLADSDRKGMDTSKGRL